MIVGADLPSTLAGMLVDWHRDYASGADVVMIARRNRDVDDLNAGARELLREEGALGAAELIVGDRPFAAGDRVQTRRNSAEVSNRERWNVLSVDAAARTIELRRVGGDERTVRLGPAYLDECTVDGTAALDYAYALTKFGAQGKTVDRAYPLLDPGASVEQELVALSRGREAANVYAVASSELIDPDLGPARRDLSDSLQDVREAIEREGNDFSASEVALRRRIERLSGRELAERRATLLAAAREADPVIGPRERVERSIETGEEWVARLSRERQAIERMQSPSEEELTRVVQLEASYNARLGRNRAELARLPEPSGELPKPPDPRSRLEAHLIERRIEQLARMDVMAGRLNASEALYRALGPYPSAPAQAVVWGEAAHEVATYRRRHNVRDTHNPLGKQPIEASARAELNQMRQQLTAAQRALDLEKRTAQRAPSRALSSGH